MFELKIEDFFAAAHNLRGYKGQCEELHGHNWKVEVYVRSEVLDDIGLAIDFADLKKHVTTILDTLDHKYLNDLPSFSEVNPSSENIAKYIYEELEKLLVDTAVNVYKVTAWESEKAAASYLK